MKTFILIALLGTTLPLIAQTRPAAKPAVSGIVPTATPTPPQLAPTASPRPQPVAAAAAAIQAPAVVLTDMADSPEPVIARFFSQLQKREVDNAYDQLTKGTKIAERAEDVKMLKSKTKDAIAVFGAVIGFEHVAKRHVGERLVSYTVVSLGKEFPLRWRFYFYRPADAWKLIDLRVDDRLAAMFDEPEEQRLREPQAP